jgi:outer membrane receptor protein involved in Fe transport
MKLKRHTVRERLLASTMIGGSALLALSAPAFAADAPSTVQEVVVTGSRIPQPGLTSVSPLSVVNNQEVKLQGTTNAEDLLNNMPQVFASFGSMESNGASGTATVNLRGLGTNRTLVLIDGKRVQPGDAGTGTAADLNQIPSALIDRVEIVTGGASAVYGSDAIAGVVNFIMKKDFEGVRFDAEYKFNQHNQHDKYMQGVNAAGGFNFPTGSITDGQTWQTTIVMGANAPDGKGNVTAYAGYQHMNPVLESHRDFSACSLATFDTVSHGNTYYSQSCVGSSTSFPGRFQFTNQLTGKSTNKSIGPNGTMIPYTGALAFNFAPFNYFQRPDERYTGGYFAHYQVRPWADAYSSFMFMNDRTLAQIAPGGSFRSSGYPLAGAVTPENPTFAVNCNNPLLTYNGVNGTGDLLCGIGNPMGSGSVNVNIGRRNVEGGPRISDDRHTSFRIVEGVRGDFADAWHYDIYGQFGQVNQENINTGYMSTTRLSRAFQVVNVAGTPTCKSVVDKSDPSCVPYDIWHLGGVSQAALNYLSVPAVFDATTTEQIVHGDVGADLGKYGIKSPWAKDGVGVSLGVEYRRETLATNPDVENETGDLNGAGGTTFPVHGSFDVKEVFGEIRVPVVQDAPFAKELSFEGGYRTSDYSSSGTVSSYKAAMDWQIVDDVRLRGSFQRAVRAPNITELFVSPQFGLFGGQDPCAGAKVPANIAGCANTGAVVGPNLYNYGNIAACSAAQCTNQFGGNIHLKPEEANTYSLGAVFTPTFLRGFTATLDWFDITVNNQIGAIPPKVALTECFDTGSPTFCSLIHRSPTSGEISGDGYVQATLQNIGRFHTSGWDYEANYKINLADMGMGDHGQLVFHDVGTILNKYVTTPVTGFGNYDCAGLYGVTCGTPNPKLRNVFRATWVTPWAVSLSMQWRYFGSVKLDLNDSNSFLNGGLPVVDNFEGKIPAYNWIDLSGTWKIKDGYTLRFGVNNVFDKDPPIVDSSNLGISGPPFGNGNTYPQVYDSLGRTFFIGLTADF